MILRKNTKLPIVTLSSFITSVLSSKPHLTSLTLLPPPAPSPPPPPPLTHTLKLFYSTPSQIPESEVNSNLSPNAKSRSQFPPLPHSPPPASLPPPSPPPPLPPATPPPSSFSVNSKPMFTVYNLPLSIQINPRLMRNVLFLHLLPTLPEEKGFRVGFGLGEQRGRGWRVGEK